MNLLHINQTFHHLFTGAFGLSWFCILKYCSLTAESRRHLTGHYYKLLSERVEKRTLQNLLEGELFSHPFSFPVVVPNL
jgi:hypothetical protein